MSLQADPGVCPHLGMSPSSQMGLCHRDLPSQGGQSEFYSLRVLPKTKELVSSRAEIKIPVSVVYAHD